MSTSGATTRLFHPGARRHPGFGAVEAAARGAVGHSEPRVPDASGAAGITQRLRGGERRAVILIAMGTALLPLLKPGGPSNIAPVDALIAPAMVAFLLWAGSTHQRLRLPYLLPLGLSLVGGAIGALIGPVTTSGMIALVQDLWLASWGWAIFNVCRTSRNMRIVLSAWVYAGVAWGTLLLLGIITNTALVTGVQARNGSRVQLTFGDPNYAANYFFITIMLLWATQRPRRRWVRYVSCAILVVVLAFTGSNGGALSLLVGTGVAAAVGVRRRWGIVPAAGMVTVAILVGGLLATNVSLTQLQDQAHSSQYAFIRDGFGRGTSVNQRGQLLNESVKLYRSGSIFGEGPASTKSRLIQTQAVFAKQAHDDYVASLMERGFIGFGAVLLLAACVLLRASGVARDGLRNGYETVVVRPNALVGAAVGTLVAASVYGVLHNRHIWTLFAIVAAASFWGRGYE